MAVPTTRGGARPVFSIPPDTALARIELAAPPGSEFYNVDLVSAAGRRAWLQDSVRRLPAGSVVVLLAAESLSAGDYEFLLSRPGPARPELVAVFPFRIERR